MAVSLRTCPPTLTLDLAVTLPMAVITMPGWPIMDDVLNDEADSSRRSKRVSQMASAVAATPVTAPTARATNIRLVSPSPDRGPESERPQESGEAGQGEQVAVEEIEVEHAVDQVAEDQRREHQNHPDGSP